MKLIAVAMDFSTRSDRALRRATLLARKHSASMVIFHVVDDDQPQRMMRNQQQLALELIGEIVETVRSTDGLKCEKGVCLGPPAKTIVHTIEEMQPDLLVIGPSRRQSVGHIFTGTVVDRVIRASRRPVLIANGVPKASYRHVMIASDMSLGAGMALEAAGKLGLLDGEYVSVVHAFDASDYNIILRGSSAKEARDYVESERACARQELEEWLAEVGLSPDCCIVESPKATTAQFINDCAGAHKADLVVVGTTGRSGLSRLLMGSIAEGVFQDCKVDVLTAR